METIINTLLPALVGYFFGGRGRAAPEALAKSIRAIVEETLDEHVALLVERVGVIGSVLVQRASRTLSTARGDLEMIAWEELRRIGIKRSKAVDLVIHELVAVAYGKLRRTLDAAAARRIPGQLDELAEETRGVVDAFRAGPLVPPLDIAEKKK